MDLRDKRILIVDDDLSIRVLLQSILDRHGAITTLASTGREAIARLHEPYDLLVLDLLMPEMSGFAVVEHLRAYDPDLLPRTLIITAAPAKHRSEVRDLPVLEKPFDFNVFVALLEKLLEAPQELVAVPSEPPATRRTGVPARKGGRAQKGASAAVSRDREHMARIPRKGPPTKPAKKPTPMRNPDTPRDDEAHTRLHNLRSAIVGLHGFVDILATELPQAVRATIHATAHDPARADAVTRALADGNVNGVPELAYVLEVLDQARSSAAGALRIINPGAPTTVDVHDTIRQAATLSAQRFIERGGALQHDLRATPSSVNADAGRLIAVWTNLLENALTAGARNATITTTDEKNGMRIVVRDDGAGIPPEVIPRLFDGNTSTKPGGGTGLKYVHSVITTLGGTITATSALGDTLFTIVLPTTSVASRS
jgi:CheY-like chemotaxis protein